jgi:hypothetical protein
VTGVGEERFSLRLSSFSFTPNPLGIRVIDINSAIGELRLLNGELSLLTVSGGFQPGDFFPTSVSSLNDDFTIRYDVTTQMVDFAFWAVGSESSGLIRADRLVGSYSIAETPPSSSVSEPPLLGLFCLGLLGMALRPRSGRS